MIKSNLLSAEEFNSLQKHFKKHHLLNNLFTDEFGRKLIGESSDPLLIEYSNKILPIARQIFNSETLLPSYSLFAEYSDNIISLYKHKDANACTYTIDLVLYQGEDWPLIIDGAEYVAKENEAICFKGEDKEHWRDTIYNNHSKYGMIFFHYVEPDHWWFKYGPEYVDVIREKIRGEQNGN